MKMNRKIFWVLLVLFLGSIGSCTRQAPDTYQFIPVTDSFSAATQINTKVDMLWVVDNSSSMDPDQQKLRNGFAAFAKTYMQPTWDIRVAAITTDTYLANPVFSNYLASTVPQSANEVDPYIQPLVLAGKYSVPANQSSWDVSETSVVNMQTGDYSSAGVTINELVPAWGPNYAKLLSGIHDGPVAGLCSDLMPYFLKGENVCSIRDSRAQTGSANCLNPTGSESSVTQCVNTVQNDTIHSGSPIISTMPPTGTPGNAAWITKLSNNFITNLTTGTAGHGSERGLGSVLQMLTDNEASGSPTQFFRPGSLRVIIFISDEDDQTMSFSPADQANTSFTAWTHYQCNLAGLTSLNAGDPARLPSGFCCSGATCDFGSEGTTCPSKTILNSDGTDYTYTVSICPNPALLMPVASVKTQLDSFFSQLDGGNGANPNYFIATVTGLTGNSVQALQAIHNADDALVGMPVTTTADRSDRYIDLGSLVGNGSFTADIASTDYTQFLNSLGTAIVQRRNVYTLSQSPGSLADMTVTLIHADGTTEVIPQTSYSVSGSTLSITDINLLLSLTAGDQIQVYFQPNSVT